MNGAKLQEINRITEELEVLKLSLNNSHQKSLIENIIYALNFKIKN
jgi:hypothetical protein